jgi:predicted ABC-type transport system involved in lysophospholipase L1 biosynthesis ATPase subunit
MMPGLIGLGSRGQGVRAPGYGAVRQRAESLLDEFGLSERKGHRPGELSGGEQQRVAVARALILEPQVVLADEPTGNLDTATGEELFKIFLDLNKEKGITFIIVTHNESLSKRCHRILRMADGHLNEST